MSLLHFSFILFTIGSRADLRRSVHRQSQGAPTDHRQQIIRMLSKSYICVSFIRQ